MRVSVGDSCGPDSVWGEAVLGQYGFLEAGVAPSIGFDIAEQFVTALEVHSRAAGEACEDTCGMRWMFVARFVPYCAMSCV